MLEVFECSQAGMVKTGSDGSKGMPAVGSAGWTQPGLRQLLGGQRWGAGPEHKREWGARIRPADDRGQRADT